MGVSEKKALALEKLAGLEDEKQIDEILLHIERLNADAQKKVYHLSKHAEEISRQYNETMKKLAE
ncbi:MAG: hypothetical protein NTW29_04245 [Bacteroidetes bacterium]|nr:hypothetical protein [Bacteroidota bacterium]